MIVAARVSGWRARARSSRTPHEYAAGVDEHRSPQGREAVLELLSELLAIAREGLRLYREGVEEAPAELRDRLAEYGQESMRHVNLLEHAIRELGGDPAHASPEAKLVSAVGEHVLIETGDSPRRWF